jgi:L-threonylcarbamoyladenylate synthase
VVTFVETRVLPVNPHRPSRTALVEAAALLWSGWPVAFPTETVYGLGGDALNPVAVRAIFRAKGRPADNPLIVHVADPDHVLALAQKIPPLAGRLIERFWPGPLTLVLRRSADVPPEVSGGLDTIAVRMPAHPVALALIREAGTPLAAPSANLSGRPSPTTAAHVLRDLNTRIPLILDAGPTAIGLESTVLDLTGPAPVLLRPGGVTLEALKPIVGRILLSPGATRARRSPGTRYRHYRPRAPVVIALPGAPLKDLVDAHRARGLSVGVICQRAEGLLDGAGVRLERLPASISGYAQGLFAAMRALDDAGVDVIVVEGVEERGLGAAVMDRLRRAATQVVGGTPAAG